MSGAQHYLVIPRDYGRVLGLRWAANHEAIEFTAEAPALGLTFAMADQVTRFLSGFHSVRPPVSFAYVLHLMRLLGVGAISERDVAPGTLPRLGRAFRKEGRPLRNAGVFCAHLCRDVPRLADPPDVEELNNFPHRPWFPPSPWQDIPALVAIIHPPELPSLEPHEFEARIRAALDDYTDDEIAHWMHFGRGPASEAAGRVAEQAEPLPRDLIEILDGLGARPRLAASGRLVSQLDGALTFPARERPPAVIPTGGYADVSTRGAFDAILPGQLALDDLEFLRRFASYELLYYHREEPAASDDEELVLLIDQGVRTWGDVRVVLSAAAIALARRAVRRGTPLRVATTGDAPHLVWTGEEDAAAGLDPEAIGALIEGSDFTESPAVALADLLARPSAASARDVVVLTHPRTLAAADLSEAAKAVPKGTRLFAVSVDESGAVELSELRGAGPVALSRCRVMVHPPAEPAPAAPTDDAPPDRPWDGDVEPIPFPFRLGIGLNLIEGLVGFDHAGRRLVAVVGGRSEAIHAWDIERATSELLPRPLIDGAVWTDVRAVVGVAGGVVLGGFHRGNVYAAHYHFRRRKVTVHRLGPERGVESGAEWLYDPARDAVVIRSGKPFRARGIAVDLGARKESAVYRDSAVGVPASRRASDAAVAAWDLPSAAMNVHEMASRDDSWLLSILFDPDTGVLSHGATGDLRTSAPMSDGLRALRGKRIVRARRAGGTLAILIRDRASDELPPPRPSPDASREILVLDVETGNVRAAYRPMDGAEDFALSADGLRLAYRAGPRLLVAHEIGAGATKLVTAKAREPRIDDIALFDGMLGLKIGRAYRFLTWYGGHLGIATSEPPSQPHRSGRFGAGWAARGSPAPVYDPARFPMACQAKGLRGVLDVLGQVTLLDAKGRLVAMIVLVGDDLAAWTPDGLRLGPSSLTGAPATPGAAQAIARALQAAETTSGMPPT